MTANEKELRDSVERLTTAAGIGRVAEIAPVAGGRNNRAFRVGAGGRAFFLKVYPPRRHDPRPRLKTEQAFLALAWNAGIRAVPEPIAADEEVGIALSGYIDGRRLRAGEVEAEHIEQALQFVAMLDDQRDSPRAAALPPASEACFAFGDHLDLVDRRVAALTALDPTSAVRRDAARFVTGHLVPLWRRVAGIARRRAMSAGLADEAPLSAAERCLSPSDFGFHNALLDPTGRLVFFDFEYAGWDDPAKLIADFFYQPQVPVPVRYRGLFEHRITTMLGLPPRHAERAAVLAPVFGVKWVCIALNDFLPAAERGCCHASGEEETNERLCAQLRQARRFAQRAEEEMCGGTGAGLQPPHNTAGG